MSPAKTTIDATISFLTHMPSITSTGSLLLATAVLAASATTTEALTTSERLKEYVQIGQQFFVIDSSSKDNVSTLLYEEPDSTPVDLNLIFWMCPPVVAADQNDDGMYDSIVSHGLTYWINNEGVAKLVGIDGYVATWTGTRYNEQYVDFDDHTVIEFLSTDGGEVTASSNSSTFIGYETSDSTKNSRGLVMSGVGEWILDGLSSDDPRLAAIVATTQNEGKLTPEACTEQYDIAWLESHHKNFDSSSSPLRVETMMVYAVSAAIMATTSLNLLN